MSLLDRLNSLWKQDTPDAKIALWITRATGEAASRIYEGLTKGHLLEKQEVDELFLPLSSEIASFYAANCVAVVMIERRLPGGENCRKILDTLFEEIHELAQYYSKRNDSRSAFFCNSLFAAPSIRHRTLAYCENDPSKLAVSQRDINDYAAKYRPSLKDLPSDHAKLACFSVRLSRAARLDKIKFEAGQKLAEMLLTNTVLDNVKGVIALQQAVADLLRKKR
jgi:hypothetical protein